MGSRVAPARAGERTDAETYRAPAPARLVHASWWLAWREDLARYRAHHGGSLLKPLLLEPGLRALLVYRLTRKLSGADTPGGRGGLAAHMMAVLLHKAVEARTGISLPPDATLGPGLYLGHFGPILIHPEAVLGAGCNISQGVSIGISGRGDRRGVPVLGDRVYVGANAVICGRITIGDDVVVGANSLANRDLPAGATVIGVPAKVVNLYGTSGMGLHQRRVPAR